MTQISQNVLQGPAPHFVWMFRFVSFCLTLLFLLLFVVAVKAHGGGQLQVSVADGPFQLSVWSNPPQARAGRLLHITVGVADVTNGRPVLDATVQVAVRDEGGSEIVTAVATTEQSVNKLFYETDLTLTDAGNYQISLTVRNGAGMGTVTFPLTVQRGRNGQWVGWGLLVVGMATTFVLYRSWQKQPTKPIRKP